MNKRAAEALLRLKKDGTDENQSKTPGACGITGPTHRTSQRRAGRRQITGMWNLWRQNCRSGECFNRSSRECKRKSSSFIDGIILTFEKFPSKQTAGNGGQTTAQTVGHSASWYFFDHEGTLSNTIPILWRSSKVSPHHTMCRNLLIVTIPHTGRTLERETCVRQDVTNLLSSAHGE